MSDTPDLGRRELARRKTDELARVSSAIIARGLRDIARIEQPKEFTNSIGIRFVPIPAGEFMMGSSDADIRSYIMSDSDFKTKEAKLNDTKLVKSEQPQHRVKITQPFFMATHEITQTQFQQLIGRNPSWYSITGYRKADVLGLDTSRFPVDNVSWFDAVEFCLKLGDKENRSPCYRLTNIQRDEDRSIESADVTLLTGDGYRLPTEAEWEYACRAGSTTLFHFGTWLNGGEANVNGKKPFGTEFEGPSLGRTTTVGSYLANAFGLYDMHGNVWEWCQDWYGEDYYAERQECNPLGPITGSSRVFRGGGWIGHAIHARAATRLMLSPEIRGGFTGFRVVAPSSGR